MSESCNTGFFSKEYCSLPEACEILGISEAAGKNWVNLGKIIPAGESGKENCFRTDEIRLLEQEIRFGKNPALKSRRNKKHISGAEFYHSYISEKCRGVMTVTEVLNRLKEVDSEISEAETLHRLILADAALQMLSEVYDQSCIHLQDYLDGGYSERSYAPLVDDLILGIKDIPELLLKYPAIFSVGFSYEEKEDVLGLLYLSMRNLGERKTEGAYYTPTSVVNVLISELDSEQRKKGDGRWGSRILDPCCGTGNFLIQLPDKIELDCIYGNDLDEISVMIARINLALRFHPSSLELLYQHITISDYLTDYPDKGFDLIIGNPPWGYVFDRVQSKQLQDRYKTAGGVRTESYDVFIEKALQDLNIGGEISFVLPEAVLNVKSHGQIRQIISEAADIRYLEYLGEVFDGVHCPCVILHLTKTGRRMDSRGMRVKDRTREFEIKNSRRIHAECFAFLIEDREYELLEKMRKLPNAEFLKNQAVFALGIVTGNNGKWIADTKSRSNECVLRGTDLYRYRISVPERYIEFIPERLQQTAPEKYYRAKEKLLYRFICSQPVFAYDNRQLLSLNSANILIPEIKGMSCKYVLAVLNSRMVQFYYCKLFRSVKVLRSYLEQIPIPHAEPDDQDLLEELVNQILECGDTEKRKRLYEDIDRRTASLYELTENEYQIIREASEKENLFLQEKVSSFRKS